MNVYSSLRSFIFHLFFEWSLKVSITSQGGISEGGVSKAKEEKTKRGISRGMGKGFKPKSPLCRCMVNFWMNTFSVLQFLCRLASNFKKETIIETFLCKKNEILNQLLILNQC